MKKVVLLLLVLLTLVGYSQLGALGEYLKSQGHDSLAIGIWKLGASLGNDESRYKLGMSYWMGDGVQKDYESARTLIEDVRVNDQRPAYYALADIYESQGDFEKALHYFETLCSDDYSKGCVRAGQAYLNAERVSKDLSKAKQLFSTALALKEDDAYFFLALASAEENDVNQAITYLDSCIKECVYSKKEAISLKSDIESYKAP